MPSKKKKYNARFPAGRIKKIMQTDEEVGKVAQAVPVIISRTLELFVESLLTKSMQITSSRNAKTLTPSHMKQCILSESRFDFLKDLVKDIPDASVQEDNENNAMEAVDYTANRSVDEDDKPPYHPQQSTSRAPVIQYSPKLTTSAPPLIKAPPPPVPGLVPISAPPKLNYSVENLVKTEPKIHTDLSNVVNSPQIPNLVPTQLILNKASDLPPNYGQNTSDNLYIDEDYDN